jgi:ketosteroid isomerase-like protein
MGDPDKNRIETNKQIVRDFIDAYTSFDTEKYEPYLAPNPTYQVGVSVHEGKEGFLRVAKYGRLLYPNGFDKHTIQHIIGEGDTVAVLMTVEATTNAGNAYRNDYALFFELQDGLIKRQVELMDFRVSTDKFDLSVLENV